MKQYLMIMVSLIKKLFGLKKSQDQDNLGAPNWKDIEYFSEEWLDRISRMVKFIPENVSVIDFGCGPMWLKRMLPGGCIYKGVDYTYRGEGSYVFDLNKYQFPQFNFDVAFVSGCLEYVNDYQWLVNQIETNSKKCIISYCTLEHFPNIAERKSYAWVNHLSGKEIIKLFEVNNWKLTAEDITNTKNSIFVFEKI